MRRLFLTCGVVASTFVLAAPKMAWVPADADAVVTIQETSDKAAVAVLRKAYAESYSKTEGWDAMLDAADKQLLTDLGCTLTPTSLELNGVTSLTVSVRAIDDDEGEMYAFIESPTLTAAKVTEALKKYAAAKADIKLVFKQTGDWMLLSDDAEDFTEDPETVLAYRSGEGVIVLTSAQFMAKADRLLAGKEPTIISTNPLAKAFEPLGNRVSSGTLILKDLNAILKRIMDREDFADLLATSQPWGRINTITLDAYSTLPDIAKVELKLLAQDEATAKQVNEAALGAKFMLMMMASQYQVKPDSAIAMFITQLLSPKVNQREVSTSLKFTPATHKRLVQELAEIQQQAMAQFETAAANPFEAEIECIECDDDDTLTKEAAEELLDRLDD